MSEHGIGDLHGIVGHEARLWASPRVLQPFVDVDRKTKQLGFFCQHRRRECRGQEAAQLEAAALSPAELKQRQTELSKMRAVAFYTELKQRRVRKIKSKL